MKRLSQLPEHERCHVTGWLDKCEHGYDECKACGHILNADEVETVVDPKDVAPTYKRCKRCNSTRVFRRAAVLPAENTGIFRGQK